VTAAAPGDIVVVGSGTYNQNVVIPAGKNGLSLFGAKAGVDARVDRDNPAAESIVIGTTSVIIVESTDVVIDGFTVQGGSDVNPGNATGVDLKGSGGGSPGFTPATGARVVNNILENNGTGVSVNSEGFTAVSNVLIEHNVIRNNNAGVCTPTNCGTGDGIFTSAANNLTITENDFRGNKTSAICINNSNNVTITGNHSEDDASFVIFTGTTESTFSNNRGSNFGSSGVSGGGAVLAAGDAAVTIGPGNNWITISHNELEDGKAPINSGISFTSIFGTSPANKNINVAYNQISNMPSYGIVEEPGPTALTSLLTNSVILDNEVSGNGVDGIDLNGDPLALNSNNLVTGNDSKDNKGEDCRDASLGSGTLNTANTWFDNFGKNSLPVGLCTPEPREPHHHHHYSDHGHDRDHNHD
jgi:hypothetical protein